MRKMEEEVRASYGFCLTPTPSPAKTRRGCLETPLRWNTSIPSNLAFHDLAGEEGLPRAAKSVLGMSLKYVITTETPSTRKNGNGVL